MMPATDISIPVRPQEYFMTVPVRLRRDTVASLDDMAGQAGLKRGALIRSLLEAIVNDDRRDNAA